MLVDSRLIPQCVYRPGRFSGLMSLYESNYLRLRLLTGGISPVPARWISRVRDDSDLHLEWISVEAYTSTLRLTYWLRGPAGTDLSAPDVGIRIYHDAAQAEALVGRGPGGSFRRDSMASASARELSDRWQRNMMLNK